MESKQPVVGGEKLGHDILKGGNTCTVPHVVAKLRATSGSPLVQDAIRSAGLLCSGDVDDYNP